MKKIILFALMLVPIMIFAEYLPEKQAIELLTPITAKDYPDADMIYIENDIIKLDNDALGYEVDEEYKKVLNEAGKKDNKLFFGYDINYDSLFVEKIKIIKKDGTVISLNPNDIIQQTDMNMSGMNIYSYSSKLLTGILPDIEIGDIIYTKTKRKIIKTGIDKYFSTKFGIENYSKYIHKYLEIETPASIELYIHDINNKGFKYEKIISKSTDKTLYSFTVKDAPMLIYEPNMDKYSLIAHHIMITSIKNWEEISRWYYNLVEKHLTINEEIKRKVQELTKNAKSRKERMEKLFYWVARKIRYLGVDKEKDRPGYEPHDVTFTFETRGGVCRDKAALLVAMLRTAKINADVILISVGNILDKEAPVLWFNHAIVMVYDKNGNPQYFLDPTDENTKEFLPAYEGDSSYLVASKKGSSLGLVPVSKPEKNNLKILIHNTIQSDNSSVTKITYELKGLFDNYLRSTFVRYTKQNYDNFFSKIASLFNPGAELIKYSHSDPNDKNRNITFEIEIKIPNFVSSTDKYYFIPFDAANLKSLMPSEYIYDYYLMSPFKLSKRNYNFIMPVTFSFDIHEQYDFKDKLKNISMPQINSLDYKGFKINYITKNTSKNIDVKFHFESSKKHFKKEEYLPLKQKIAVLSKYQNLYIIAKRR